MTQTTPRTLILTVMMSLSFVICLAFDGDDRRTQISKQNGPIKAGIFGSGNGPGTNLAVLAILIWKRVPQ